MTRTAAVKHSSVVKALLGSEEPSIRWKVRTKVLSQDPDSRANRRLGEEIRNSPRVRALIDGAVTASYRKWQGQHWVLQTLAELGYPAGGEPGAAARSRVAPYSRSSSSVLAATALIAWWSGCCTGSGPTADGTVTSSPRR